MSETTKLKVSIKDMVKNKIVEFCFYQSGELWYKTECHFMFRVPVDDTGSGVMNSKDKAILYMRWIRKEIELQESFIKLKSDSNECEE